MASEMIVAKLIKKAKNGKGFQLEGYEGWFNANDKSEPFLAKIGEGVMVEVGFFKKGVKREVTLIRETASTGVTKQPETKETAKSKCKVCGADLKDDKYPTCWGCKDKLPKEEGYVNKKEELENKEKTNTFNKIGYGSAEDIVGKEVGCAANCAATILSGRQEDLETLLEMFRILFNGILEHIRSNK